MTAREPWSAARWDDPIDHAALQAEWRELKGTLDALIEDAWTKLTTPEIAEADFAIRHVRARINELAQITTYAEDDTPDYIEVRTTECHAGMDGECFWADCPQLRDGEPLKSGRHCPLDREPNSQSVPRP